MASYIDMSLEDIIQKKKKENIRNNSNKMKKQIPIPKQKITDARFKIISKKRMQITDARDKLAELAKQKDARLKIEQLRKRRHAISKAQEKNMVYIREKKIGYVPKKDRVFIDPSRQVISQPLISSHTGTLSARRPVKNNSTKMFMDNRIGLEYNAPSLPLKPIMRTVENDLEIIDDPMGEEFVPKVNSLQNRKASLQLKIIAHNNDLRSNRTSIIQRSAVVEKEQSPPRPQSILKKRPMAATRNEKKLEKAEKPVLEYRVIVSNLRDSVTARDIEELFGDIGGMLESRLVRPGTAEIIYKSSEDAQKAVDLYHNRRLDGQPMNCLLVTPRSATTTPRSSNKPALYSTNSNVEPDISTFYKVLFSKF